MIRLPFRRFVFSSLFLGRFAFPFLTFCPFFFTSWSFLFTFWSPLFASRFPLLTPLPFLPPLLWTSFRWPRATRRPRPFAFVRRGPSDRTAGPASWRGGPASRRRPSWRSWSAFWGSGPSLWRSGGRGTSWGLPSFLVFWGAGICSFLLFWFLILAKSLLGGEW